jgi:(p)ppGpp synthase/HD superfamily hydrolase
MMVSSLSDFTKRGFVRLIQPFENSTDDLVRITRAFSIAMKAHAGNFRDESQIEPFIHHPLKVALVITEELNMHSVDLVCAALLHDVAWKDDGDLKKDFGENIYNIISSATIPNLLTEGREKALTQYFYAVARSPVLTRYLILADRLENIRALRNNRHKSKILRYKEETQRFVLPIAETTDEKLLFKLSVALYELK